MSARRYELTDFEWSIIAPLLPDKPRGVPRADDRKVLNRIYWRLRTGSPWADIPERYGPSTTCYKRFVRWRKIGVWDAVFAAVSEAYDRDLQMVASSSIRVHQHAANVKKGVRRKPPAPPLGTSLQPDASGARGVGRQPRYTPLSTLAAIRSRSNSPRAKLMTAGAPPIGSTASAPAKRHWSIAPTTATPCVRLWPTAAPGPTSADAQALNAPAFSPHLYRFRNLIERFFSKLKHFRAVATRFEKHDANYLALVKLAAARIWMRFISR